MSCSSKIHIGFTFLVRAHLGSPGQRAVKRIRVCTYLLIHLPTRRRRSEEDGSADSRASAADVVRQRDSRFQTTSSTPLPPPRSLSFYDNLSLCVGGAGGVGGVMSADPQSELELILDDLRRNISALDAALSTDSPSPSTHGQLIIIIIILHIIGWLGSLVVDSGAEGPRSNCSRDAVG